MKKTILFSMILATGFVACKKTTENPSRVITQTTTLSVPFSSAQPFSFFRFKDSTLVANSDSNSVNWDFGLRFTTFIVNSHASGPGNAGAILADGTFDGTTSAPSTGYAYDTTNTQRAIKDGSWYNYNPITHAFSPLAGKVFLFKTADGSHYVKMELLSVNYGPFTGPAPTTLLYNFRYSYQANGTTTF